MTSQHHTLWRVCVAARVDGERERERVCVAEKRLKEKEREKDE